jgi:DNA-binding MarR family transcriptional regulator
MWEYEYSPGFMLCDVTLRWQREVAGALAPLGLTHVQFVLLTVTYRFNEHERSEPNQLTVARQAGIDVKISSQVLGKLEAKDLIRRTVDPSDTRAKRLRVTPAGAHLAGHAVAVVEAVDKAFFAAVPDHDKVVAMLAALR